MNIVHSGDHVVLIVPRGISGEFVQYQKVLDGIPDSLKDSPVEFRMTTLPLGAIDSTPQVLFILRK